MSSDDVPARARGVEFVVKSAPALVVIVTTGSTLSRTTTVLAVKGLPARSVARTSMVFEPARRAAEPTLQDVVPEAAVKATVGKTRYSTICSPLLSDAVPAIATDAEVV